MPVKAAAPAALPPLTASATSASAEPGMAHLAAVVSRSYQSLALKSYDAAKHEGHLQAAYGETVGYYADWAQVSAQEIRAANNLSSNTLQPGRSVVIPLPKGDPESFNKQRIGFHQQREASFFAEYSIAETKEVLLKHGQTMWNLAQSHGVPMWLLYRENPSLLQRGPVVGTKVNVPVLKELPAQPAAQPAAAPAPAAK